ncbi:MAG TPA: ABC transporter permease [Afifellaceae bacterium]|nr:ABC transporter permease [Afifellaceae bacterium]
MPVTLLAPSSGWAAIDLRELWNYRELLVFLAWRDIKVRYKQTMLGAAWAVLVPLLTMIVFNLLFGLLMGRDGKPTVEGVPYPVSTYAALVPWQLFAFAMGQSAGSLVANRNLITKVYFPRLIAPLAPILSALVDFAIAFAVLILIIAAYHLAGEFVFVATWRLALLPVFVALAVMTALALSMWLSALNALYRDVKYVIPFLTQLLMFVSPVVYTTESIMRAGVPEWARILYALNPLAGVLEGFRWALLGGGGVSPALIVLSSTMVLVLFVGGLFYFRRMERLFADLA